MTIKVAKKIGSVLWVGMATGRVRTGFLHAQTQPAGLSQKPELAHLINEFFLVPHTRPVGPHRPRPAHATSGLNPWPNK